MKKVLVSSLWAIFVCMHYYAFAQNNAIYLPREYQRALKNNTRSKTGAPGEKYFQNRADYVIDAAFDPQTRILAGKETITYFNNSPDSL